MGQIIFVNVGNLRKLVQGNAFTIIFIDIALCGGIPLLSEGGAVRRSETDAMRTILTSSTSVRSWQTISQPSSRASISRSSIFIRLSSSSRTELHFSMV